MSPSYPEPSESRAQALLHAADYLSRPQQFVAVAEARAALRHTLERVHQGSVVLTHNGEPEAALIPFTTLEAIRSALIHLLVDHMQASHEQRQDQAAHEPPGEATDEAELDALVGDAVRRARQRQH